MPDWDPAIQAASGAGNSKQWSACPWAPHHSVFHKPISWLPRPFQVSPTVVEFTTTDVTAALSVAGVIVSEKGKRTVSWAPGCPYGRHQAQPDWLRVHLGQHDATFTYALSGG